MAGTAAAVAALQRLPPVAVAAAQLSAPAAMAAVAAAAGAVPPPPLATVAAAGAPVESIETRVCWKKKNPAQRGKKNRCMPAYSIMYYVMLGNVWGKQFASVAEDVRSQVSAQALALR